MRKSATVLAAIGLMALTTQAHAAHGSYLPSSWSASSWASYQRWRPYGGYEPYRHRHHARAHHRRSYGHYGHRGIPGPCYEAARKGGPCGCTAESIIFGTTAHVFNGINHWLARAWLGYPRTSPRAGTAAVWGTHHVEAVIANNGDGTITTSGPYGNRRVRIASVVIVDPHGGYSGHREGSRHYAWRHYAHHRRWRYARAW